MTKKQYQAMIKKINNSKPLLFLVTLIYKLPAGIMAAVYAAACLFLLVKDRPRLFLFIVVPVAALLLITGFRKIVNRSRPYDRLEFKPLFEYKKGKGQSFPSRHTSSAFIIAMACFYINSVFGIMMLFLAIMVGVGRVLSGMHYISDVLAGAALSIIAGILAFGLL